MKRGASGLSLPTRHRVRCSMGRSAVQASSNARCAPALTTDLDLSTPEGLSAARDRVHQAAREPYKRIANPDYLSRESNYSACGDESFTSAMAKLTERAVGVVAESDAGQGNRR